MTKKSDLHSLVYQSEHSKEISEEELQKIYNSAKDTNLKNEVSGILIVRGNYFLQFLEGDINKIVDVFIKIKKDKIHKNIQILVNEPIKERVFHQWSMGIIDESNLKLSIPEAQVIIDSLLKQKEIEVKKKIIEILKVFSTNMITLSQ